MEQKRFIKHNVLRMISMVCVLVVLFSAGTVKARADEVTGYQVDSLLTTNAYDIIRDGNYSSTTDIPSAWINVSSKGGFFWTPGQVYRGNLYVFNICTYVVPSSLSLNGSACTLEGSQYLTYSNRYISQWSIAYSGSISSIELIASWSSSYSGSFYIVSANSYSNFSDPINSADVRLQAAQITAQGNLYNEHVGSEENVSFPYVYLYEGNFVTVTFAYGYCYIYIRPDDRIYDFADKISLLFTSVGATSFGAYLVEGQYDDFVTDLPLISREVTASYTGVMFDGQVEWKLNQYLVEVDLSGQDLRGKTIVFDCHIEPMQSSDFSADKEALYGSILGISMTPEIADKPWYTDFSRWLSGQFSDLIDAINGLGDIFGSNSNAGQEAVNQGSQQSGVIDGLNDQINSVVKPDLSGSGSITGIITPSNLSSHTSFLSTVVNAPYINQVISLALILSLAGYVLFGKR